MSRAVVFDLDDTLAVTERDRKTLLSVAADRADISISFDREAYREAHREHSGAETRQPVFEELVGGEAQELTRAYREVIGEALQPVAGAEELLETLRSTYRIGLLTDGPGKTQRDKLRRLGWEDTFDATVVTGPLGAPKPDRRAFDAITEILEVVPERTVYVGNDPERDIVGAQAAGMRPVQVCYPGGPDPHPSARATVDRAALDSLLARLEALFDDRSNDA